MIYNPLLSVCRAPPGRLLSKDGLEFLSISNLLMVVLSLFYSFLHTSKHKTFEAKFEEDNEETGSKKLLSFNWKEWRDVWKKCWLVEWNCSCGHMVIDRWGLPTLPCKDPRTKYILCHTEIVCAQVDVFISLNWRDEAFSEKHCPLKNHKIGLLLKSSLKCAHKQSFFTQHNVRCFNTPLYDILWSFLC